MKTETIKKTTLCYLRKNGRVLMLYRNKKNNDPCEGKWVGIGGKFEPGEDADICLKREIFEETGLRVTEYKLQGIIRFVSDVLEDEDMYLYLAWGWDGNDKFPMIEDIFDFCDGRLLAKPVEILHNGKARPGLPGSDCGFEKPVEIPYNCNEGTLAWVKMEDVLKLNLWEGDKYFLEPLLAGENEIYMTCEYAGDKLVSYYKNK